MPGSKPADDLVLNFVRFAVGLAAFVGAAPAEAVSPTVLTRAEYADIRDVCVDITGAAHGRPYHVVALGKSPSAFVAFFRAIDRRLARQLPLTRFHYGDGPTAPLDEEVLVPKLFRHFDRYLPSDEEMAGKRLLVVDFTATGGTARAFDRYFRRYLKERARTLDYQFVAIHLGTPPRLPDGAYGVAARAEWLDRAFTSERFDDYALRGDFDIRKHSHPEPGSGRFEDMLETMQAHLARDAASPTQPTVRRLPCAVALVRASTGELLP